MARWTSSSYGCPTRSCRNTTKRFANSGIRHRNHINDPKNRVVGGYQADFKAGKTYSGILYEERGRGTLAGRGQEVAVKPDENDKNKHNVDVVGSAGNFG